MTRFKPEWDAMAELFSEARKAYENGDDKKVRALAYLLQLGINDLVTFNDPSGTSRVVHSAGVEEIQAKAVRKNRKSYRKSRRESDST